MCDILQDKQKNPVLIMIIEMIGKTQLENISL